MCGRFLTISVFLILTIEAISQCHNVPGMNIGPSEESSKIDDISNFHCQI